jgi:hypothetical protein
MPEQIKKVAIPAELFHPFFFSEKDISLNLSDKASWTNENFYFELLFFNGIVSDTPWMSPELFLPILQEEWGIQKRVLEDLHRKRLKNGIIEAMKKSLGLFLEYLYWNNGKPVCLNNFPDFSDVKLRPVNLVERAEFIAARPGLYHSFVQLCELMIEMEKLAAKENVKKASNRK